MGREKSKLRDAMRIDRDVPIAMDDGLLPRADLFRPTEAGRSPAILTHGPHVAPGRARYLLLPISPPKGSEP